MSELGVSVLLRMYSGILSRILIMLNVMNMSVVGFCICFVIGIELINVSIYIENMSR